MPVVAEILIPLALDTPYSYVAPAGLDLAAGDVSYMLRRHVSTRGTVA